MISQRPWTEQFLATSREILWDKDFLPVLFRFLEVGKHKRILDVACGLGHLARLLEPKATKAEEILGVDIDQGLLRSARRIGKAAGSRVRYRRMDAATLSLKSDSFDLTAAMTLFMNVPDPAQILREMIRVTRPGGLIAAIEPIYQTDGHNEYAPGYTRREHQFMAKLSRRKKSSFTYVEGSNKFVAPELPNMFSQAGLTDIDTKVFGYAHQRRLAGGNGSQYLEIARRRIEMIESGQVTPETILWRLPTNNIKDAYRYIEVTRSQLVRFLRDPESFANMVFFSTHTMLAIKGRKTGRV